MLSPSCDTIITPKIGKYKRRNSGNSLISTPISRPTRSTAGQIPAHLKSSSPQSGSQGTIISTLLYRSHSPKVNKSISGRRKNKEKRKYKTNENHNQSFYRSELKIVHIDLSLVYSLEYLIVDRSVCIRHIFYAFTASSGIHTYTHIISCHLCGDWSIF